MTRDTKKNLTPAKRARISVAAVAQFALQGYALRDLKQRPAEQVRGPKKAWAAASFINYIGPIAYLGFGRKSA